VAAQLAAPAVCAYAEAGGGVSSGTVYLDPARFNTTDRERLSAARDIFAAARALAAERGAKRAALAGGAALLALFLFVIPRAVRPNLEGAGPAEIIGKLSRFFTHLWGDEELKKLAWACVRQDILCRKLARRLNEHQLREFLNFLYIEGAFRLYAETLFLRRDVFGAAAEAAPALVYGQVSWAQIKNLPQKPLARALALLNSGGDAMAAFQAANALARQLVCSQEKEKAVALLESIPVSLLHKTTWETLLEINGARALPPHHLDALPRHMLAQVVTMLVDEGNSQMAKALMDRNPRDKWSDADYLAYFTLQLETDPTLANEFYPVFARNVDIRRATELHYLAAKRCEQKGHADIAVNIYRKFTAEGINYRDAVSRYNMLHQNLSVETRNYTIMMTDIKGYTSRTASETPAFMMEYLRRHNDIVAPVIRRFKGKIVKSIGDAFLAVFESSSNAVACGVEIQESLAKYNAGKRTREAIYVRVALNAGEVSLGADGDIYGDAVNITARLEGAAQAGEVWLTEAVTTAMSGRDARCLPVGPHDFKGAGREIMVYRIAPGGGASS